MKQSQIRNFAIIAHIDHGKSTLADRFMELTGTVQKRESQEQLLDSHPISRERGITIRLAPVTMKYQLSVLSSQLSEQSPSVISQSVTEGLKTGKLGTENRKQRTDNREYVLNLIDTPGHVDFSYEVERSLAACEGAILLVDATQGVQAQTLSHFHKAKKLGLTIIPAINKIDSPNARVADTEREIRELMGIGELTVYKISAKTGEGVEGLLKTIVEQIPPPSGSPQGPTRALVFSSQFESSRGVTAYVRIVDGSIQSKSMIRLLATNSEASAFEIGHFSPAMKSAEVLETGEVGYVVTSLKDAGLVKVGDTIMTTRLPDYQTTALPGYHEPKPMVFVSIFPVDQNDFPLLNDGLKKLKLNDAAITFSLTSSKALGRGFRCGFLGHLHAEVSQERLEQDFGLSILATMPTVEYQRITYNVSSITGGDPRNTKYEIQNTANQRFAEPWVKTTIITPELYMGNIITLCEDRRGKLVDMSYSGKNVTLNYNLPLAEIITDFFDQLKSKSAGFASMDYEFLDYRPFDSVQLEVLINHEAVDAFSQTMEKSRAEKYGRFLVERLKGVIPRQQIPIPIQAVIDGQIIARADVAAFRKDVTAKLYGGDVTRRMKLLEKQKKGKEKMKLIGKVQIPGDTFLKIFRT